MLEEKILDEVNEMSQENPFIKLETTAMIADAA